jgi:hypothetical protein
MEHFFSIFFVLGLIVTAAYAWQRFNEPSFPNQAALPKTLVPLPLWRANVLMNDWAFFNNSLWNTDFHHYWLFSHDRFTQFGYQAISTSTLRRCCW